jgi:hypothetical protein
MDRGKGPELAAARSGQIRQTLPIARAQRAPKGQTRRTENTVSEALPIDGQDTISPGVFDFHPAVPLPIRQPQPFSISHLSLGPCQIRGVSSQVRAVLVNAVKSPYQIHAQDIQT